MLILLIGITLFAVMIAEAMLAARHDVALRAAGAVERRDDVYPVMQIVYPGSFLAMLLEGFWRGAGADAIFAIGAAVFVAAKALKYWAIATLGARWTFRVLVPPGSALILRGPYRWFPHPNYIGVMGELLGLAIAMHSIIAGPLAVVGFALILMKRISVEEQALGRRPSTPGVRH